MMYYRVMCDFYANTVLVSKGTIITFGDIKHTINGCGISIYVNSVYYTTFIYDGDKYDCINFLVNNIKYVELLYNDEELEII